MSPPKERIRKIIVDFFSGDAGLLKQLPFSDDFNLIETGVLDSFSVVKLMMFIEKEFNIKIQAEDLTEENIATLASIEKMIILKMEKMKSHG